jgi:plastocyanin
MKLMTTRFVLLLFSVMLFLNSCSFSDKPYTPLVHHVQIRNMVFEPSRITVHKGDTVIWTNLDIVAHDVTEEKTKSWTSSPISIGKSWKMAVSESVDYYCSIHVVMKGKIIVENRPN